MCSRRRTCASRRWCRTMPTDIRDSSGESFALVESLGLRAGVLEIVAITCVALGSLMVVFVLVRLAGRARRRTPAGERTLATRQVVGAAIGELTAVQREREQQGWNDVLAARALGATRIAAAGAIGRPVSQRVAVKSDVEGVGRVQSRRPFRGQARALSSPVTAGDLAKSLARRSAATTGGRRPARGAHDVLTGSVRTRCRYRRDRARRRIVERDRGRPARQGGARVA